MKREWSNFTKSERERRENARVKERKSKSNNEIKNGSAWKKEVVSEKRYEVGDINGQSCSSECSEAQNCECFSALMTLIYYSTFVDRNVCTLLLKYSMLCQNMDFA